MYPPCPPRTLLALCVPSLPSVYPPCPLRTLLALCAPSLPSVYDSFVEQLENISHTPVNFQYDLAHTQSHPCTCAKDHSSKNNLPTVKGRTTTLPAPPTCCTLKQPSLLHPAAIH
ncbi:hypothetical protein M405DRAFT_867918 [Rhizopogon salebrosus TDB-379]|nr:hypothetical protein M405DRAFT_867918 [Rhizopogon salebrosus TDB-379]